MPDRVFQKYENFQENHKYFKKLLSESKFCFCLLFKGLRGKNVKVCKRIEFLPQILILSALFLCNPMLQNSDISDGLNIKISKVYAIQLQRLENLSLWQTYFLWRLVGVLEDTNLWQRKFTMFVVVQQFFFISLKGFNVCNRVIS